jgi:aquaporin Z
MTQAWMTSAAQALRNHWPEYVIEACGLAVLLFVSVLATAAPLVPIVPALGALGPFGRRAFAGFCIAGTVVLLVYSRWGRQSGAHFNPSVTLTFLALGRVRPWDAAFYIASQVTGGIVGIHAARWLLGGVVERPPVRWIVTVPGHQGAGLAFAAELVCAFVLMSLVLVLGGIPRLARLTGLAAGMLIFCYILFESPISGFSLNPARSFASALPAGVWMAFWIYVSAPPLGMLLAALFNGWARLPRMACAKLIHDDSVRCIHCGFEPPARQARHSMLSAG